MINNFETPGRYSITLIPGVYLLEVWGAQGGVGIVYATVPPGYGGFSNGTLVLTHQVIVYVYVGGQGDKYGKGGFNGGGNSTSDQKSAGGGGASDIRIGTDSLYSRIIVAGGGGGVEYSFAGGYGGSGGGKNGGEGYQDSFVVLGATQEGPGQHYGGGSSPGFGVGGSSIQSEACGGGGGWYGGGTSKYNKGEGSGGSGYIFTKETYSYYPNPLIPKSLFLINAHTIQGNTSFLSPSGASEVGHRGNGAARITLIELLSVTYNCKRNNFKAPLVIIYVSLLCK